MRTQHLPSRSLVILLLFLGLILVPIGGSLATAQEEDNQQTEDDGKPTEVPVEEGKEPIPTEQLPTNVPATEPAATEPGATEPAPTTPPEPVATEVPATEVVPTATVPAASTPTEPAGLLGGPASTTTLVMVSGTCDVVIGTWPEDATSLAGLQATCDEYVIDNTFTYTYLDTGTTQTQTTTGGTTSFAVDPGSFRVESVYPSGMRNAAVGCASTSGSSYVRPVFRGFPPNDLGFSSHIDLGDTLTCYWYNLPLQPTIINLVKGECDVDGFDPYTASSGALASTCIQQAGDATFTYRQVATGDPASELEITQTTVASRMSFTVRPGNFNLQEDIPAGYGDPVVSCLIERLGVHVIFPAPGGLVRSHIDSEGIFTCHWYNVPLGPDPEDPEAGSITVVKYRCGPVTWWRPPTCPILKTGQGFGLQRWNGTTWEHAGTGITGRDGRLTWTDLPPGTYRLDELGRDWCRIESENLEPGGKGITVNAGEDAVVHVYNCAGKSVPPPIRPFPIGFAREWWL